MFRLTDKKVMNGKRENTYAGMQLVERIDVGQIDSMLNKVRCCKVKERSSDDRKFLHFIRTNCSLFLFLSVYNQGLRCNYKTKVL